MRPNRVAPPHGPAERVNAGAPILAATAWRNNAELIADAARLGYIGARVLDPTYGRGKWWTVFRPAELVAHDLRQTGVDYTALPAELRRADFDTVAFDPPYVVMGGRSTTSAHDFTDRYGLIAAPRTVDELRAQLAAALGQFRDSLRPGGTLLVKCMPFVSGGAYHPMPRYLMDDAEALGYRLRDELIHLRSPGPQPPHPVQRTSRRNYSTLLVFDWPGHPRRVSPW